MRAPGSNWEYSNTGYTILGLALAHRADLSFDELLKRKIFDPLGLANTFPSPPTGAVARPAEGHDAKLNPCPPIDLGIFAPAGALCSTADDLARFLRAVMPGSGSPVESSEMWGQVLQSFDL